SPSSGAESGGTRVVLRGSNFVEPAAVFFGELPATGVVVLDEVSVAATTPEGVAGAVDIRLVTAEGQARLDEGFTYVRALELDAVQPARVPDEGGVMVTVRGHGFDEQTLVLFDRQPLRGARWVGDTEITGWLPALAKGRPEIRVVNAEATVRRSDLMVVFATPRIAAAAPGRGVVSGGSTQSLAGEGFDGASVVTVGGRAVESFTVPADDRLQFSPPALPEGQYDVAVANEDASGRLAGGYIAIDTANPAFGVIGVMPDRASAAGGTTVTVFGRGFSAAAEVSIGGRPATIEAVEPQRLTFAVPAGLGVGPQTLSVSSGGQRIDVDDALVTFAPLEVSTVEPSAGPASGGTRVTITGRGFVAGVDVRIAGVPLTDISVVSDTEIVATTGAGASGRFDVRVQTANAHATLPDGFAFESPFEVIRIEPAEGSIAGNTYVTVLGRGFSEAVDIAFGGVSGVDARIENGSVVGVRTAPSSARRVDVEVSQGDALQALPRAYRFFNPRLLTGGAFGGPIDGAVNVAVGNSAGQPLPGVVVQLGFDGDPRYRAVTDLDGLATISAPEIRGPQTVTAGLTGVEHVTFVDLNAQNLTVFAANYPQSIGDDDPRSPCPGPTEFPLVTGRVFKLKSGLDPDIDPNIVPVVQITYSEASVYSPNPPDPLGLSPSQFAFVVDEGGEYAISVLRAGAVAVYALFGELNTQTQQFTPKKMGIVRSVAVAPGAVTSGVDISLDIDIDASTTIRLDDPPQQQPGPSINAVFPFLNLGSDGVIPFGGRIVSSSEVQVTGLPSVSEDSFFYLGGSFSLNAQNQLSNPYSLTLVESAEPFELGVDVGPFLEMPDNVSPKPGELLQNRQISWRQGGVVPDISTLNIVDVRAVTGCCCDDLVAGNSNGQCDEGELDQCGTLPQQFNRWSLFSPGSIQSYELPRMPTAVRAFDPPARYAYILQTAVAPRFSYREFVLNQFNPFFWQSWSVFSSSVLVKEETD
ncbi:MAG: IPT/TIG domain-containing protein, partial [Myxococcota bacterium]